MEMGNHFLVDEKTGLINLHYESLNPSDVLALIAKLEANVKFASKIIKDPIQIMQQSAKRRDGFVTFQLDWNAEEIEVDLSDPLDLPSPNVELTLEQYKQYQELLALMLE